MTDFVDEAMRTSTEVMSELVAKAHEAVRAGESRRSFFSRTAKIAGATVLGAAGAGLLQPIAAHAAAAPGKGNNDTLQEVIDIAATAESLATTFYYNALAAGSALPDVNSAANQNYFQAAVTQEFEHLKYLRKLGAKLLLEEYFIAAYLQASLDFSGAVSSQITTANPYALGFAVQVMGVECEHRALLGVAANVTPPNDRFVERALLKSVAEAVHPLKPFLAGGNGFSGPIMMPNENEVNAIAQPYGFSFFPKYKIV